VRPWFHLVTTAGESRISWNHDGAQCDFFRIVQRLELVEQHYTPAGDDVRGGEEQGGTLFGYLQFERTYVVHVLFQLLDQGSRPSVHHAEQEILDCNGHRRLKGEGQHILNTVSDGYRVCIELRTVISHPEVLGKHGILIS
jgi:hypothetical protein